jgi:hypothetical protein
MTYEPQDELVKKEGYYSKFNITAADTTAKYESSSAGDPYNQEMIWIWNTYHNVNIKKDHFKYLYYDEKPLTTRDIRNIYKDVMPK